MKTTLWQPALSPMWEDGEEYHMSNEHHYTNCTEEILPPSCRQVRCRAASLPAQQELCPDTEKGHRCHTGL